MRAFLFIVCLSLTFGLLYHSDLLFAQETQNVRPNIIFIMADDHTKNAISSYGSCINQTPNIDRIAREGMRFENCFVTNSICAPSRAVILTGKYSHINGLRDNRDEFDGSQMIFPKLLQEAGYQTALIGKWHLKTKPEGFDYWKILQGQGSYYNPTFIEMGDTVKSEGYSTTLITDFAIQTIDKFEKEKPFCLLYHHKAPHRNWMPDLKHLSMYDDSDIPVPETFFDTYGTRSAAAKEQDMEIVKLYNSMDMKINPDGDSTEYSGGNKNFDAISSWNNTYHSLTEYQREMWDAAYESKNKAFMNANLSGKELAVWKYQRYIKDYLRCVASVDENIGRLLDYLDQKGLAENTIVLYTSDQGFFLGEHGWYDKRFMYEESLGIPLLIRYPSEIRAGTVTKNMVLNLDFCATILDYAGIRIPDDVQGRSLRPILQGEGVKDWRQSMYYHYYEFPHGWHDVRKHYGIRTERYKLIHFYDNIDAWELYDLEKDPMEINNIYGKTESAIIEKSLRKEMDKLQKQYGDINPTTK